MSLTKEIIDDKIEVVGEYKFVQIRTATVIKENGEEISRSFSRRVINPGEDYSSESTEIQNICSAVHTDAVVSAYQSTLEAEGE